MNTQVDPSNPKNQYDYVGKVHNEGLENFIRNYKNINGLENDSHLNFEVLLNANALYLGDNESLMEFNAAFTKNENLTEYFKFLTSEKQDYVKALDIVNFNASDDFKKIYQNILTQVDAIDFSDVKSLDNYLVKIKALEEGIAKSSVTKEEQGYLLASSSISRFSAVYWFDVVNTKTNWDPRSVNTASASRQIIKMDVAGGVGGAVVGAIVGGTVTIYAFGIGAIPGWAAGAITGTVGGSVTQAVIELWEWMFGD